MTCAAFHQTAGAQEYVAPPVSISKDKVKIDGKVFYSHIVLEKQTLFSISKAYDVSIEDIYRYNPDIKENGLRKNDIINIPVINKSTNKKDKDKEDEVINQTQPERIKHTVKWYEDLSSIAEKYHVTEDAIVKANGLKDKKVKSRQVLIIPEMDEQTDFTVNTEPDVINDEAAEVKEVGTYDDQNSIEQYSDTLFALDYWNSFKRKSVNATLIMPFKASAQAANRNNMDFYSGVLIAAHETKEKGGEVYLNVYDIAEGLSNIPTDILKASDVIIGPIAPDDIIKVSNMADGACPIVSPLDQRGEKLASQYPHIIQVPSSQISQFIDLADWIKEDMHREDKVLVISEKEARQNDGGKVLQSIIDQSGIHYTPLAYSILEGRDIQSSIEAAMTKDGVNRVVIASESEAFVNDAVRNLNLIVHNKFSVVLYGPAKIRTFETIEVENFHNTALHASLTYNIDYDNEAVQDFVMKYRAMFGTEPTQFAFQGYDIARYFFDVISQHHSTWTSHMTEDAADMLQNRFMFKENDRGSYVNSGIRRIIYDRDYSIIPVQ